MGLDISKITRLTSDLCSEVRCKLDCCHEGMLCEFDNKDSTSSRQSETTLATLSNSSLELATPAHSRQRSK